LGEEVGKQDLVVKVVSDGVVALGRGDEVAGNEPGALVDQLVERVLSVGPGLAPDNRASGVVDFTTRPENTKRSRQYVNGIKRTNLGS
jgi:hypothetical protein